MDTVQELLRPTDVAPILGVTPSRVYQMISAGQVPAVRVAGSIRIPLAALNEWLAQKRDMALEAVRTEK
jgi:excisionase family DNA binding protein